MRVLVTGGTGSVGRAVVRELVARGHEVKVVGRRPDQVIEGAAYQAVDITDFAALKAALAGFERVIHLAAVASPGHVPDPQLFDTNVSGTFKVYEACAAEGIGQVAVASSINALGNLYGVRRIPVHYFPIDEAHPSDTTDSYSFSKLLVERLGQYAWDRYQIRSVSLRIPAVVRPDPRRLEWLRRAHDERQVRHGRQDFWCLLDSRDSARAFALGIEADYQGAHTLFINDSVNSLGLPSRELAAAVYPQVTEWRAPMQGDEALITCRRAREVIGWEPQFSWRGVAAGEPAP